jgi:hypothetical protein
MSIIEQKILNRDIQSLPFSEDFKTKAAHFGFNRLRQIVDLHVADLLKIEGFTYHMLQEYIQYMQENKMAHLIMQH